MSPLYFLLTILAVSGLTAAQTCSQAPAPYKAMAILVNNGTAVTGTIFADQAAPGQPVIYTGQIRGLVPRSQHGIHIHWYGDLSIPCTSAGDHFNPTGSTHGDISSSTRHVGDLGNVLADASGTINLQITDSVSQLVGANSVIGRMFIVHGGLDDYGMGGNAGSLANGNSGPRVACGIIGIRQN